MTRTRLNINAYIANLASYTEGTVEDQGLLNGAPELAQRYFDYKTFGRDLDLEGNFYRTGNGYIEIIR